MCQLVLVLVVLLECVCVCECVSNALGGRTLNLKRRGVRAQELIKVFEYMEYM